MRLKHAVLAVLATVGALSVPTTSTAEHGVPAAVTQPGSRSVTLLTGDRVTLAGSGTAAVDPGPGRDKLLFQQYRDGAGHVVVIPEDARAPLAAGRLDRRLFDVTALVEQGYDDVHDAKIRLLVSYATGRAATVPLAKSGAAVTRDLPKLRLSAMVAPKRTTGEFWRNLRGSRASGSTLANGVAKVWLNQRVKASLDQSVPQIGAPELWHSGLRGDGVTVAVLDSGYDKTHRDLASAVTQARGFTDAGTDDTADGVGHGTHVASIVAGRGVESAGKYTGVAPGATLIVGKVLDDAGYGYDDWILAGMQWAVDQHARVVNMSLGGGPTDGTDPLSEAINQLTRDSGTLFVVAAGNFGADQSVASPGAATEALTVGSVTKQDSLSPFSSRGPRIGDAAIKPDLTAPGSDIVAARAVGTPAGDEDPVDDHYTRLSGTSMAAPHVAGAAALLAQKHPEWTAAQLKAALMTTARPLPDQSVYAQGAGRIDVAAAARQSVSADVGSLNLGRFAWPYSTAPAVSKKVVFHNPAGTPVTLTLTHSVTDGSGKQAPVVVTPESLSVPAHGDGTVTVTVDPAGASAGLFGGALTATTGDGSTVRVLLGASFEAESYNLTVTTIGRDGQPTDLTNLGVIPLDDPTGTQFPVSDSTGQMMLRLPKGRYAVAGFVGTRAGDGSAGSATASAQPNLDLGEDTHITFDARAGKPIGVRVPGEPTARQVRRSDDIIYRVGGVAINMAVSGYGDLPFYAVGVDGVDGLDYHTYANWMRPEATMTVSAPESFEVLVEYADTSARFVGDRAIAVVDGGLGRPEDLAKVDARGKLVLLRRSDDLDVPAQLAAVVQAGAAMAIFPRLGFFPLPITEPTTVPVFTTSRTAFDHLASLAAQGAVSTLMHGYSGASPYSYNLVFSEHGGLPAGRIWQADQNCLAAVVGQYRSVGKPGPAKASAVPDGLSLWVSGLPVDLPMRRVDFYTPGGWSTNVYIAAADAQQYGGRVVYEAGRGYTSRWNVAVIGPKLVPVPSWTGGKQAAVSRIGNTITATVAAYSDATPGTYAPVGSAYDAGDLRLSRDGRPVGDPGSPDGAQWQVPADEGTYQLRLQSSRVSAAWQLSTKLSTVWTFRSKPEDSALPLLGVYYQVPLDDANAMDARHPVPFTISVARQELAEAATVDRVQVWSSFDDGATWQALTVQNTADGWRVTPPTGGRAGAFVSLRVAATDSQGNAVDQTVIRAYRLK
ncbi:MAG: S8 family serine peptidase [Hamadaea sp.]|uniref:S8 family serine peptidase n=1 Tax=Hamadaea sp. TaxID=2024425 RepID=UPI0017DB4786|nr:S8 family serine peptidase [Hamadaea sp.]NUT21837.1 S8 family serine peptidase [Hamadaea sp.]